MRALRPLLRQPPPYARVAAQLRAVRAEASVPQLLHADEAAEDVGEGLHGGLLHPGAVMLLARGLWGGGGWRGAGAGGVVQLLLLLLGTVVIAVAVVETRGGGGGGLGRRRRRHQVAQEGEVKVGRNW